MVVQLVGEQLTNINTMTATALRIRIMTGKLGAQNHGPCIKNAKTKGVTRLRVLQRQVLRRSFPLLVVVGLLHSVSPLVLSGIQGELPQP